MDLLKIIGNLQKLAKQMLKEGIILELPEVRQHPTVSTHHWNNPAQPRLGHPHVLYRGQFARHFCPLHH